MNLIFKSIAISSIFFVTILSADNHYVKYIFSESFSSHNPASFYSNSFKSNQTSMDTGCDFLNLCGKNIDNKLNEVSLSFNNKIVDISYLNSYLQLPFP